MVSQTPGETPARSSNRARIDATFWLNSQCHEPASRNMACLTVNDVVKGPGVNSNLSLGAGEVGAGSIGVRRRIGVNPLPGSNTRKRAAGVSTRYEVRGASAR